MKTTLHIFKEKWIQYLLEIIVIVLGILAAFALDNWNEIRKDRDNEQVYLTSLRQNLKDQIASLDIHFEVEKKFQELSEPLLLYYQKHQSFLIDEKFTNDIGSLATRKTFKKIDASYQELLSSGNLNLIKDKAFKNALVSYYQDLYRIESIITYNNNSLIDLYFSPTVANYVPFNSSESLDQLLMKRSGLPNSGKLDRFIDIQNPKLIETSKKLLSKAENELIFVNALNKRRGAALIHQNLISSIRNDSENLINNLNKLIIKN